MVHLELSSDEWQTSRAFNNQRAPFDQNFHIILNLAIGGHFDGYRLPPQGFNSSEMLVDYVRVFQK